MVPSEHAHHGPAMILGPGGAVGSKQVRPKPPIAVDRRGRECSAGRGMLQQAAEKSGAERGEVLALAVRHECVLPAPALDERLMQMPAVGVVALERWAAHECRDMAHAAAYL